MGYLVLLIAQAGAAASSDANPSKRLEPPDSSVAAPMVKYESAFTDYQPFREPQIRSWKEVNKEVADNPSMGHNMGAMNMPGNKMTGMEASSGAKTTQAATGHDMSAMKSMPGKTMPGMDTQTTGAPKGMPSNTLPGMDAAGAAKTKPPAAGHDMSAMKSMPGKTMPGMDMQTTGAPRGRKLPAAITWAQSTCPARRCPEWIRKQPACQGEGSRRRSRQGSMKAMAPLPGMNTQTTGAPKGKESAGGHDMATMKGMQRNEKMAMAHPESKPGQSRPATGAGISGTGVVQGIDKNSGKIKLTHEPVAALGWPKMTMFFRLKDAALAEKVDEGDKVEFSLEKSASGFVISALQKVPARNDPR